MLDSEFSIRTEEALKCTKIWEGNNYENLNRKQIYGFIGDFHDILWNQLDRTAQ